MIVDITISSRSFVFIQSCVEVSTSLSNVGGLAVGAFDLINRSLSVVRFVSVFNVGQYLFSSDKLSVVLQTSCGRLFKVLIVVALWEVGL